MKAKTNRKCGGVHDLEDLRLRCFVEPECGCWRWKGGKLPSGAATIVLTIDGIRRNHTGKRAALLLAGVKPKAGEEAIPHAGCPHADCVNPGHAYFGDRSARNRALVARGVWSNPAGYAAMLEHTRARRKLDDAQRLAVIESPEKGYEIAKRLGVSKNCISLIRRGAGKTSPPRSVFDWRP